MITIIKAKLQNESILNAGNILKVGKSIYRTITRCKNTFVNKLTIKTATFLV